MPKASGTQILLVGGVNPNNPLRLATAKNIASNNTYGANTFHLLPKAPLHIPFVQSTNASATSKIPFVGLLGSCFFNFTPTIIIKMMIIKLTTIIAKLGAL